MISALAGPGPVVANEGARVKVRRLPFVLLLVVLTCACGSGSPGTPAGSQASTMVRTSLPPIAEALPSEDPASPSPAADAGPSLSSLATNFLKACQAQTENCKYSLDGSAGEPSTAFCDRALADAAPFFEAAGIADQKTFHFTQVQIFGDLGLGDPDVRGIFEMSGPHAGCVGRDGPESEHFSIYVAPPGSVVSFRTSRAAAFGKRCHVATGVNSVSESGVQLACTLDNGWSFEISEVKVPSLPDRALSDEYDLLVNDL